MFGLIPLKRTGPALRKGSSPFELVSRDLGAVMDRLFPEWPTMLPEGSWDRFWGVAMEDTDRELVVRFELPGFEANELEVLLAANELAVAAAHKVLEEKEEVETRRVRRVVTLPPNLDLTKMEATYRNGILEVHVPRTPEAVGRRIEVKA
jgi:HSP20 family protein